MTLIVFNRFFRELTKSKGQLAFLSISVLISGLILPVFVKSERILITTVLGLAILFLNQNIGSIYVREKEKKTLETLLSSPVSVKNLINGAFLCYFSVAILFSIMTITLQAIILSILGNALQFNFNQTTLIIIAYILAITHLVFGGIIISLTSENIIRASQRMAFRSFMAILFFSTSLIMLELNQKLEFYVVIIPYIVILCFLLFYKKIFQAKHITQENILIGNLRSKKLLNLNQSINKREKGSSYMLMTIFKHEWRLVKTYSFLAPHFLLMIILPSVIWFLTYSKTKESLFATPIIISILLVLRIPTNLISISIGGEKAYNTFESLLSTPIPLRKMFMGKILPAVVVSGFILVIGSFVTLLSASIIPLFFDEPFHFSSYSPTEWIMQIGCGFLAILLTIFVSGYLALTSKTPRVGLWISSFATVAISIPHILILYFAKDNVTISMLYFALLVMINIMCFNTILNKVDRKVLLGRI